jgi:hypothetical protein
MVGARGHVGDTIWRVSTGGAGTYWVVFGMVAAIVISMLGTWVLLIEILR